jgi:adenylate cyclase
MTPPLSSPPLSTRLENILVSVPVLILLFWLIPGLFLRQALVSSITRQTEDWSATARKALVTEARTFTKDTEIPVYLARHLDLEGAGRGGHHQTPAFFRQAAIPDNKPAMNRMVRLISRKLGAHPSFCLFLTPQGIAPGAFLGSSYRDRGNLTPFQEAFRAFAHSIIQRYLAKVDRKVNMLMEQALCQFWGVRLPGANGTTTIDERFFFDSPQRLLMVNIPMWRPESNTLGGILHLGFLEQEFLNRAVIRRMTEVSRNPICKRFLTTTFQTALPQFRETAQHCELFETMPGHLYAPILLRHPTLQLKSKEHLVLGIRISKDRWFHQRQSLLYWFNGCLGSILLFLFASWHRFRNRTLPLPVPILAKIALAFLLGTSLPIMGITWFGVSYAEAEQQLNAEEALQHMSSRLSRLEHHFRAVETYISRIHQQALTTLQQRSGNDPAALKKNLDVLVAKDGFLDTTYAYHQGGWEHASAIDPNPNDLERFKIFFRGPAMETLAAQGSFAQGRVGETELQSIQNLISLSLAIIEKQFNIHFFCSFLSNPGTYFDHPLSAIFEILHVFYLGQPGKPATGVLFSILSQKMVTHFFMYQAVKAPQKMLTTYGNYRLRTLLYRVDSVAMENLKDWDFTNRPFLHLRYFIPGFVKVGFLYPLALRLFIEFTRGTVVAELGAFLNGFMRHADLHIWRHPISSRGLPDQELLKPTGIAILRAKSNVRLNNLHSQPPHLVVGKLVLHNSYLALMYAVPTHDAPGSSGLNPALSLHWKAGLFGFGTFLLALAMAFLSSHLLSRPLRPFFQAISATAQGDFRWAIELDSRDEFNELAHSFNAMGNGLLEKNRLSRFVSTDVLQGITQEDDSFLKPGGERIMACILFSDIRGFTTLSETHPPEEIVQLLNTYFTAMVRCVKANQGIVNKFIGDAVLAVFYQKAGNEDFAKQACQAAFDMRRALAEVNHLRREQQKFTIETGIGIAGGAIVAGRIGSAQGRLESALIGKTVQIAAQLEAASKKAVHTGIMLDPATIRLLRGRARIAFLERLELESGRRSLPVYELLEWRDSVPTEPEPTTEPTTE